MAQQTINTGTLPNDGTGDPLQTAFDKCNDNFTELYNADVAGYSNISNGTSNVKIASSGSNVTVGIGGTGNVAVFATTGEYVTGLLSVTGNITGGNLSAVNLVINNISSDDSSYVNIADGLTVVGEVSAIGNITGGNVLFGSGIVSGTGNITGGPYLKTSSLTVATLPSASTAGAGARSFVSDATATTFASIVAGGGGNPVPVFSDGTNWKIG